MANVLRSFCNTNSEISFLIVSVGPLSDLIADALEEEGKRRNRPIVVHRCETISHIIEWRPELGIDFLIFAYDGRVEQSLSEIEADIHKVNINYFETGCACLINCNNFRKNTRLTFDKANKICKKYNLRFMSANIFHPDGRKLFSERILNLSEAVLGYNNGIPLVIINS